MERYHAADQAAAMTRQPNFGRFDGESDASYIERLKVAMLDIDENSRMKEPEIKAEQPTSAIAHAALPIRRMPFAGQPHQRAPRVPMQTQRWQ